MYIVLLFLFLLSETFSQAKEDCKDFMIAPEENEAFLDPEMTNDFLDSQQQELILRGIVYKNPHLWVIWINEYCLRSQDMGIWSKQDFTIDEVSCDTVKLTRKGVTHYLSTRINSLGSSKEPLPQSLKSHKMKEENVLSEKRPVRQEEASP